MKCSLLFILIYTLLSSNITFSQGNIILYNASHPFEKTYKFPRSDGAKDFYIRHIQSGTVQTYGKIVRLMKEQVFENNHNNFLNGGGGICSIGFWWEEYRFFVKDFSKSRQDSNIILKGNVYYMGCEPVIDICLTTNSGANFNFILYTWLGFDSGTEIDPSNDSNQYLYIVSGNTSISKSTNKGANWGEAGSIPSNINLLRVKPGNSDIMFAGGNELFRSTNGGINFHSLNLNQLNITSIEFHPGGKIFLTSDGTNAGIFLSTDNGSNWQNVMSIKTSCMETDPDNTSRIYSGTEHGVYLSLDEGLSWSLYNNDFNPSRNIIGLMKNPGMLDTLYAVNSNNIYKIYESIIVGINEISGIPEDYILYQNYPNPFNPSTVISYSLKENSFVTLKIFDITGREVSVLVNERQNAGKYDVYFSSQSNENNYDLSSGVYFYQLIANDFIDTKRMILLK